MFDLFFTSKIEKQKMEEEQRGRELVYEEMVRKYLIMLQHFWLLYITKFYIIIRNSKHRL